MLDKYNHFLYELRRATMLGPLIENVSIWSSLEQRCIYFDDIVNKKYSLKNRLTDGKDSSDPKIIGYKHSEKCAEKNRKLKKTNQPIICCNCK